MNRGSDRSLRAVRTMEKTGRTVEEAVRAAALALRVPKENLDIEILDEGRGGFLGLGAKEAKVRVRVRAPEPPSSRRAAGGDRRPAESAKGSSESRATQRVTGHRDAGGREGDRTPRGDVGGRPPRVEPRPPRGRSDAGRGRPDTRGARRDEPRRADARREESRPPQSTSGPVRAERAPASRSGGREREIERYVNGVLSRMGMSAQASASFSDDAYIVQLEAGEDDALLIGKGGETLDAIQHVVLKMLSRMEEGTQVRVDLAEYRHRHEEDLADQARKMAEEVLRTGNPITTGLLKAAERRVVHRIVAEVQGATTRALGDGLLKKILITAGSDEEAKPPQKRSGTYGHDQESGAGEADEVQDSRESDVPVARAPRAEVAPARAAEAPTPADASTKEPEWGRRGKPARGLYRRR